MAMPPEEAQDTVYRALVARFTAMGLDAVFNNGLLRQQELPGTDFPYAVLDGLGETTLTRTNRRHYDNVSLQVSVYDRDPDLVELEAIKVRAAIANAPLPLTGALGRDVTLCCIPQGVHYMREQSFYRGTVEFTVKTTQPHNRTPGVGEPGM
jgi:hypothetical protein